MLDLLRGENLLGISVDDSREKVLAELGEPSTQDIYLASGSIFYQYNDVEITFYDDNNKLCYVVFYGKGRRGKFRLPWFIKDKDRIRRGIKYENMIRLLEKNNIFYALRANVGGDKYLDIKNGNMSFYDECEDGNFILYALYLYRI